MRWNKWLVIFSLGIFGLTGCAQLNKLVYRIDISQGNYIEQEAVNKLRLGMSKEQVAYVLGTPALVENGYPDTWYYIHYHEVPNKGTTQKNLIVDFDPQGKLISAKGDFTLSADFDKPLE